MSLTLKESLLKYIDFQLKDYEKRYDDFDISTTEFETAVDELQCMKTFIETHEKDD